jgi:hypothetical protein
LHLTELTILLLLLCCTCTRHLQYNDLVTYTANLTEARDSLNHSLEESKRALQKEMAARLVPLHAMTVTLASVTIYVTRNDG